MEDALIFALIWNLELSHKNLFFTIFNIIYVYIIAKFFIQIIFHKFQLFRNFDKHKNTD